MKQLDVPPLPISNPEISIDEVSLMLNSINKNEINTISWPEFDYLPSVKFAMAFMEDRFFLKYYVSEKYIRAVNTKTNSAVWEDSCVEFFISFDEDKAYYNFEFNCIGTALVGYGESRTNRNLLSKELVNNIISQSVIENGSLGKDIYWELMVVIPKALFCYHKIDSLKGKKCRANFYKCGDNLPIPHFVSWTNIIWPEPNFHLPHFFGTINLL